MKLSRRGFLGALAVAPLAGTAIAAIKPDDPVKAIQTPIPVFATRYDLIVPFSRVSARALTIMHAENDSTFMGRVKAYKVAIGHYKRIAIKEDKLLHLMIDESQWTNVLFSQQARSRFTIPLHVNYVADKITLVYPDGRTQRIKDRVNGPQLKPQ